MLLFIQLSVLPLSVKFNPSIDSNSQFQLPEAFTLKMPLDDIFKFGCCLNPLYLGKNSKDPDEMQHNAAFHQGLHCLKR